MLDPKEAFDSSNIHLSLTRAYVEELSHSISDLLCWLRGWQAARGSDDNSPFGIEDLRAFNIKLKRALEKEP